MKKLIIISLIILTSNYIIGQTYINTDTSKKERQDSISPFLKSPYHNIALYKSPKGQPFLHNQEILFNSVGMNINDVFEFDIGLSTILFRTIFNTSYRSVFNASDKTDIGFGASFTFDYNWLIYLTHCIYKFNFFTGLTFNRPKSIHSININYDFMHATIVLPDYMAYNDYHYQHWYLVGITYVNIGKIRNNLFYTIDNKFMIAQINYKFPTYIDFPKYYNPFFYLPSLENQIGIRYKKNNTTTDIGMVYNLGIKENKIKFVPFPYFSFTRIF